MVTAVAICTVPQWVGFSCLH